MSRKKKPASVLVCTRYPKHLLQDLRRAAQDAQLSAGAWIVSACQQEDALAQPPTNEIVTDTFCVRWPVAELAKARKAAKRQKISFSEYLRRAVSVAASKAQ